MEEIGLKLLIGSDPHEIIIPINKSQFEKSLQTSTDFQIAFLEYFGEISFYYPSDKLWDFFKNTEFVISRIISSQLDLLAVQGVYTTGRGSIYRWD